MDHLFSAYRKKFEEDQFAKTSGIKLLDACPGYAKAEMVIGQNHLNAVGVVQGGAIFTLADFTFAVASNTHGKIALAINAEISFFKAVSSGTLTAIASEISLQNKLGTYLVQVLNEKEECIAHFKGTVYRKNEEIDFQ
jgi:acyl-CoA thioesterase